MPRSVCSNLKLQVLQLRSSNDRTCQRVLLSLQNWYWDGGSTNLGIKSRSSGVHRHLIESRCAKQFLVHGAPTTDLDLCLSLKALGLSKWAWTFFPSTHIFFLSSLVKRRITTAFPMINSSGQARGARARAATSPSSGTTAMAIFGGDDS